MESKGIKYYIEVASKQAVANLELVNKKLEEMEKQAKALEKMRQGALAMGAALGVGLGMAVHQASKLESALAPVRSVLSGTAEEVATSSERMKEAALQWSTMHVQSSEQFLEASYNMLSAGLNEVQALAGTQQALALATATMGEHGEASQLLGTLYNNFGNKANDATKEMTYLSDTVTKTQQLFQIKNLAQYNEGLKNVAGTAVAAKIPFDQVSTVIGQLNTNAKTGAIAGSALKTMLLNMTQASQKLGFEIAHTADGQMDLLNTIANIKAVGANLDMFKDAFGAEASDAVVLLTDNLDALQKAGLQVKDSMGATAAAQKIMEDNPAAKLTITLNKLSAIGAKLGATLLPPFMLLLSGVGMVLDSFNWLLDVFPPLRIAVTGLLAVFATGLTIFGSWVFWTKTMVMWQNLFSITSLKGAAAQVLLGATSVGAGMAATGAWVMANLAMISATLGVTAIIAGIVLLIKHWDTVWAKMAEVRDMFAVKLVQAWDNFWGKIGKYFTSEYWSGIGRGIMQSFNGVWDNISNGITTMWQNMKSFFTNIFSISFWKNLFDDMVDGFIQALTEMWQRFTDWWSNIVKIARGEQAENPLTEQVKEQQKLDSTIPVTDALPQVSSGGGTQKDLGLNREFFAANGIGDPVAVEPATLQKVQGKVQNMGGNSSVNNSKNFHIAQLNIDGANIRDWESFKLELSSAVASV